MSIFMTNISPTGRQKSWSIANSAFIPKTVIIMIARVSHNNQKGHEYMVNWTTYSPDL